MSDRAVAAICSSMMEDLFLINEFIKLDRSKVRRRKHRVTSTLRETHHCNGLVAIAYDSEKMTLKSQLKNDSRKLLLAIFFVGTNVNVGKMAGITIS